MEKTTTTLNNGMQVEVTKWEDKEYNTPYLFGRNWTWEQIETMEAETIEDGSIAMATAKEALSIIREAYRKAQTAFDAPVEATAPAWKL